MWKIFFKIIAYLLFGYSAKNNNIKIFMHTKFNSVNNIM